MHLLRLLAGFCSQSGSSFPYGTSSVTYTATDASGNTSAGNFTVTVSPVPNAGTISGPATVCVGSTINLSTNGNTGGTWTSGNPAAATVNPLTGEVTGVAAGTPTIFYTVTNSCGTSTASYTITVNAAGNPGTINGASVVCVGSTILLSSNGTFGGTWSSGTTAVAAVNNPAIGFVTGVTTGTATIFYLVSNGCGTSAASFDVTVNPLPNPGTISGSSSVCAGSTIILASNGNTGGTWTSGTPAAATVNPTTGVVTGISAGNSTIFYTVTNSCNTATSSFQVTVNTLPNAGTVSGATSVCAGSTIILSSNGIINGTWSSGTEAVATVNPASGAVTGLTTGSSIITYSVTNACGTSTASITITVNPLPNAGAITGASSVCIGSTINLSSSGDIGGTWSSGTPAVATIDPGFRCSNGHRARNSTIRYTLANSCGNSIASFDISVNASSVGGSVASSATVCSGANSGTLTLSGQTGSVIRWESSINGGTTWTTIANTTTSQSYLNLTQTTLYRAVVQNGSCTPANSSAATITVSAASVGGSVASNATVCSGTNSGTLTFKRANRVLY